VSALLLVLLAAEPGSERLLAPEVAASTGVFASAWSNTGIRLGDAQWAVTADARGLIGGLTGELQALALFSLSSDGAATSIGLVPRIGWTGRRWSVLVGASVQLSPTAKPPTQVLPSLRARFDFTEGLGISAGLFDVYGQIPFHLSAELGDFSLGWAAPLGFVVGMRFRLPKHFSIRVQGFVYRLLQAEQGMLTLGFGWEGA
jgi:hypothetical protein